MVVVQSNKRMTLAQEAASHGHSGLCRKPPKSTYSVEEAEIGFLGVLHTWGQNLLHHPHLHCLVPGGGISPEGTRWIACRRNFFLPVRVLSRLFHGLFLHELEKAFTAGQLSFCSSLQPLRERVTFLRHLAPARRAECRVGGDVAGPTPHRPGRADFPHPVRQFMVSLRDRPSARHERVAEEIPRATDSCAPTSTLFSTIVG